MGQSACFAIVIMDANNLKYINDRCGHDAGDRYLKGCCHIACEIFDHSPVFRIGGDEFAIVLTDRDYEQRDELIKKVTDIYIEASGRTDAEPWERYSMSVGMAEYTQDDQSSEAVMKRADKAMYEYKAKFKEKYGSYR